jgi:hypothetical protein
LDILGRAYAAELNAKIIVINSLTGQMLADCFTYEYTESDSSQEKPIIYLAYDSKARNHFEVYLPMT